MYKRSSRGWIKHIDFTVFELLSLFFSLRISAMIWHSGWSFTEYWNHYNMLVYIMLSVDFIVSIVMHTFDNVVRRGYMKELGATIKMVVYVWTMTLVCLYIGHIASVYSRMVIALAAIIHFAISYCTRVLWKIVIKKINKRIDTNTLIIIASREESAELIKNIRMDLFDSTTIVGIVTRDKKDVGDIIEGVHVVATMDDVVEYVKTSWVDEVMLSATNDFIIPDEIPEMLVGMGITVHVRVNFDKGRSLGIQQVATKKGGMLLISNSMKLMTSTQSILKRTIDIVGGLFGCILVGILYLFIAPQIKKASPGPVFFKQKRVGRNGRTFMMYKFRSMYPDAEEKKKMLLEQNDVQNGLMFKMEFDPRVIGNYIDENGKKHTGIGDFIRRKSIDEFPQFINVLKGDMSLVGTRPPTLDEYEKYELHHRSRLAFPVGLTGLWQVSGRSEILDFEKVVSLDNDYIRNWSIALDIKIILKTIGVVIKGKGAK